MEHSAEQRLSEMEAEVELRSDELAAVIEHLPVGVAILDAGGRQLRTNRRAEELLAPFGRPPYEAIRLVRRDGSDLPLDERPDARAARGEVVHNEIVHVDDAVGVRHAFATSAAPIHDGDGTLMRVIVTFADVTERLLRDAADRDFVANAAHQIRTPITAIATSVAALQAGAKHKPADRDRFLQHLEAEVDRLTRLGEALLTLTRAQRTNETPDLAIVPMCDVLEALVAEVAPLGVDVQVDCASDVAALSNRPLLEQALANLLENAAKNAAGEPIAVVATRHEGSIVIEVIDHGRGMGRVDLDRAFDRFYRGEDSTGGFGLGLPIAHEAIRAAGGTLELESTFGVGTRARVTVQGARLLG
jgi:signal transduction histidine kinase